MNVSLRLGLFYFTYFAGLGVMLPWFNIYFEQMGLSAFQIGILSAIVPAGKPLFSTLWTFRADREGGRRGLTVTVCVLSAMALLGFFPARTFAGFVLASVALAIVDAARLPLVEATTMDLARDGRVVYGRIRGWGSIGFIVSAMTIGWLLIDGPIRIVLYAAAVWAALNAVASTGLPRVPHEPGGARTTLRAALGRPGVALFLSGCLLMQASHGAYYAFFSIHMRRNGHASASIGTLWALGVLAEVLVMFFPRIVTARLAPSAMMTLCAVLAAARWGMLAWSAESAIVAPAQVLHAFTFAAFHIAAVSLTHQLFPADLRASGQALFAGLTYGLGTVAGTFVSGALFDRVGPWRTFAASSLIALAAAGMIFASDKFRRGTRRPSGFGASPEV